MPATSCGRKRRRSTPRSSSTRFRSTGEPHHVVGQRQHSPGPRAACDVVYARGVTRDFDGRDRPMVGRPLR
jgi:hypothetical protein